MPIASLSGAESEGLEQELKTKSAKGSRDAAKDALPKRFDPVKLFGAKPGRTDFMFCLLIVRFGS